MSLKEKLVYSALIFLAVFILVLDALASKYLHDTTARLDIMCTGSVVIVLMAPTISYFTERYGRFRDFGMGSLFIGTGVLLVIPWLCLSFLIKVSSQNPSFPLWMKIVYWIITGAQLMFELMVLMLICIFRSELGITCPRFQMWRESRRRIKKMEQIEKECERSYPSDHCWESLNEYAKLEREQWRHSRSPFMYYQILHLTTTTIKDRITCRICNTTIMPNEKATLSLTTWEFIHESCYRCSNYYEYGNSVNSFVSKITGCDEVKELYKLAGDENTTNFEISKASLINALIKSQPAMRDKYLKNLEEIAKKRKNRMPHLGALHGVVPPANPAPLPVALPPPAPIPPPLPQLPA